MSSAAITASTIAGSYGVASEDGRSEVREERLVRFNASAEPLTRTKRSERDERPQRPNEASRALRALIDKSVRTDLQDERREKRDDGFRRSFACWPWRDGAGQRESNASDGLKNPESSRKAEREGGCLGKQGGRGAAARVDVERQGPLAL